MLSVRSTSLPLAAGDSFTELLRGEDCASVWRVLDLYGDAPFEARLRWTAAAGLGPDVLLTVARGTRVCIYASSVSVEGRSLVEGPVSAGVNIGDSSDATPTRNVLEVQGAVAQNELEQLVPFVVPVASFAQTARLDGSDGAALGGLVLELLSHTEDVLAHVPYGDQPERGLPLGSASFVRVSASQATGFRLVFGLAL